MTFHVPEDCRVKTGPLATDRSYGNNGLFFVQNPRHRELKENFRLCCIASDGYGWQEQGMPLPAWEHVSVSTPIRTPTWKEMCWVKAIFWDDEDTVMQLHPPKSEWVNCHEFCLHLWRPIGIQIPRPPNETVGPTKC